MLFVLMAPHAPLSEDTVSDASTRLLLVEPDRQRYRFRVTKAAIRLLEEALKLDPAGRAELAAELIASLDVGTDEGVEAAWAAEIEERVARARSGDDPGEPWSAVRGHVARDLRGR